MASILAGPPYHTVTGNNVTVYIDLRQDSDGAFPTDNILAQIGSQWGPILAPYGLTLTIALRDTNPPPLVPPPPQINVISVASPPGNVSFFRLTVGRGANADPPTRANRISYVTYATARGYIYQIDSRSNAFFVPAISHELAHILGLADRYYEGMYWLLNMAIDRTCKQVRRRQYYDPPNEYRDGLADPNPTNDLPRLAERMTLPMAASAVADPQYNPFNNLMSTGRSALSPAQIAIITSVGTTEPAYRTTDWVAVLGDWRRLATPPSNIPAGTLPTGQDYPASTPNDLSKWPYPAWEAGPSEGGQGLLMLPPNHVTPHRYACLSRFRRARDANGQPVHLTRLAIAAGKKRVTAFGGATYNKIGVNMLHPHWMCYTRQVISSLMRM